MHQKVLDAEEQKLIQELNDIDQFKLEEKTKEYEQSERLLDEQDKTITRVAEQIHKLRDH